MSSLSRSQPPCARCQLQIFGTCLAATRPLQIQSLKLYREAIISVLRIRVCGAMQSEAWIAQYSLDIRHAAYASEGRVLGEF